MASSIRSASSWLLVALPLLTASAAEPAKPRATPPKPPATAGKEASKEAKVLFDWAQREYDLGNFEGALGGYSEAYRLMPAPALLFNMGQCHRQLGQYERAAFFYRRYLALEPDSPDAPLVTGLIQQMEAKLAEASQPPASPAAKDKQAVGKPLEVPLTPEAPPPASSPSGPSWLRSGWFWAGVGVVAAGATATVLLTRDSRPEPGLGTVTVP